MSKTKDSNRRLTPWPMPVIAMHVIAGPLAAQTGWHTVKDKTGACQMSYPPSWTLLSQPGLVNSPQGRTSMVLSGLRPYRPYSQETLGMLAARVLEDSSNRAFWAGKPVVSPPFLTYHVESPGKTNSCVDEITVPSHTSEDEVKKMALSLSKTA
jgi:hypothetical protein